jgi:hypothetical protein
MRPPPLSCSLIVAISAIEAYVATVNVASELTTRRIGHGAEMSRNLRFTNASKQTSGIVTFVAGNSALSPSMEP